MFLRQLMGTPRTCPIPILLWETGSLLMEHRVAKKKLMFYHHLINLPTESLAFEVAKLQDILGYPGLVQECKELIKTYKLPEPHPYSTAQWRMMVKRATLNQNKLDLLQKMEAYKKLDHTCHAEEAFGVKGYLKALNIPDARLKFALRSKMTQTVQMNFKREKKFMLNGWRCVSCYGLDSQEHLMYCEGYKSLRIGKNLESDQDLVSYFRSIIKLRLEAGLPMTAPAQVHAVLGARSR